MFAEKTHRGAGALIALAVLATTVLNASAASAKPCGAADGIAEKVWVKYSELAMKYGCASSTLDPKNAKARAQAVEKCEKDPMAAALIRGGLVHNLGKGLFTKNPRQLSFAAKEGSLTGTLGRTWVNPEPIDQSELDFVLEKTDGRGKVSVEVCAFDADGTVKTLWETTIDNGKDNVGKTWSRTLKGARGSIITATIDGKSVTNKFSYTVRLKAPNQGKLATPSRRSSGKPIEGIADLHGHIPAHLGFSGAWIYPDVEGPLRCAGDNHGISIQGGTFRKKHPDRRTAAKWEHHLDTTHQQFHIDHLKQAYEGGLRLIIAPAVSNEFAAKLLTSGGTRDDDIPRGDMASVILQLRYMNALAAKHDWIEIARDPFEARQIIERGHLAIVLEVEVSNLMPKSEGDWQHQLEVLYDLGVRAMELAHETDNQFAGRATHHGFTLKAANFLTNPPILSGDDRPKYQKNGFNARGLTPAGRELVREMARRKMVLTVDHVSRLARRQIYEIVTDRSLASDRNASRGKVEALNHYPIFFSHSRFDALQPSDKFVKELIGKSDVEGDILGSGGNGSHGSGEYMATDFEVLWVRETGGVFGMRTGSDIIMTYSGSNVANTCQTSSRAFAQSYTYALRRFGIAPSFGTDLNGFVAQTAPRFGKIKGGRTCSGIDSSQSDDPQANRKEGGKVGSNFDTNGLVHVGYLPDLARDLGNLGVDTRPMRHSAEAFLRMWERTYDENRKPLDAAAYSEMMGIARPDDVRPEDTKASEQGKLGGKGEVGPKQKTTKPSCPHGATYEARRSLNGKIKRDRCISENLETAKPECKLAITDKEKNWTGPHAQKGADECRSKKGKKAKPIKCKSGFELDINPDADVCVAKKQTYSNATCPDGFRYKQDKDGDVCIRKN